MANQYDTNLKLQAIADAIGNSSSSGLISALEDIADAVAGGGGGGSSTAGLVSDNFSETDTYDLGDYCIHNNTLYVCINAITTPGPWDLSDWQATNAGIQLSSLNSALANKLDKVDNRLVTNNKDVISAINEIFNKDQTHKIYCGVNWNDTQYFTVDTRHFYYVVGFKDDGSFTYLSFVYNGTSWIRGGLTNNTLNIGIGNGSLYIPRYIRYIVFVGV